MGVNSRCSHCRGRLFREADEYLPDDVDVKCINCGRSALPAPTFESLDIRRRLTKHDLVGPQQGRKSKVAVRQGALSRSMRRSWSP